MPTDPPPTTTRAERWRAPRAHPTTYPGAAPAHHHLLLDGDVHPVEVPDGDVLGAVLADGRRVDDVLADRGAARLADRVPMLAYGANRNPHTLALKLVHHGAATHDGDAAVPVLTATVPEVDVVVAGASRQGYLYADLTASAGTVLQAHLTLLDDAQLRAIHDSEGVGRQVYECARVPGVVVGGTAVALAPLAYAGCHPVYLRPATGQPIAFAAVPATGRRAPALEQVDALAAVIEDGELAPALADALGVAPTTGAAALGREAARVVNGGWWYAHHTGDRPGAAAQRVHQLLLRAVRASCAERSTAARWADEGRVVPAAEAYAAGAHLRLAALLA